MNTKVNEVVDKILSVCKKALREELQSKVLQMVDEKFHDKVVATASEVKTLVVDTRADDKVCRLAIDEGVAKQHARVSNLIRNKAADETIPLLQHEMDLSIKAVFQKADEDLQSFDDCASVSRAAAQEGERLLNAFSNRSSTA